MKVVMKKKNQKVVQRLKVINNKIILKWTVKLKIIMIKKKVIKNLKIQNKIVFAIKKFVGKIHINFYINFLKNILVLKLE